MKITYNRDQNIAYLRLRPPGTDIDTIQVSDELNVDIAADGSIYGIELLNANEQLRAADKGKLVLVDQTTGKVAELPLWLDSSWHHRNASSPRRSVDVCRNT